MSDPTDYHRKLAEAIAQNLKDEGLPVDMTDCWAEFIEAVLASEGAVDPEEVRNLLAVINRDGGHRAGEFPDLNAAVADAHKQVIDRIAEVERLEAERNDPWSSKTYASVVAAGMERAAKIAEGHTCAFAYNVDIAAAIRAGIKEQTS